MLCPQAAISSDIISEASRHEWRRPILLDIHTFLSDSKMGLFLLMIDHMPFNLVIYKF